MRTMSTQACRRGGWCCGFLSSKPHSVLSPRRPPSSIPSLPILPFCPPPGVYSRRTSPALPGPSTPPSVPPNAKFSAPPPPFFPFSPSRCPSLIPPPRIRNDLFLTDGTFDHYALPRSCRCDLLAATPPLPPPPSLTHDQGCMLQYRSPGHRLLSIIFLFFVVF